MKRLKTNIGKKVAGVLGTASLASMFLVGGAVLAAPAAHAQGIDMNLACQYTYNNTKYKGELTYPSQGAYGWRCIDRSDGSNDGGVDVYGFCVNVLGGSYTTNNPSDPYSWQCY